MRILIVDDDPDQLHWLEKSFLAADGFDTYSAWNGREAFGVYQAAGKFDAVVTDYQMPQMNGVELITAIRRINPMQHCVLQTTEREILLPGTPQLHKPYPLRALIAALRLPVQPLLF